jgi:hypothetical protein
MSAHANDNGRHTAPIITRLRRAGRFSDIGNLVRFSGPDQPAQHADNDDVASGFAIDTVYEVRPTEGEIERACRKQEQYGIGLRFNAKGEITHWRVHDEDGNPVLDEKGGERWFEAREGYRQARGKRRKSRAEVAEEGARHLAIPATGSFPGRSGYVERGSGGADYWRLRHAFMLQSMTACNDNRRAEIDRLGVGGRHSFDEAWSNAGLPPASRIPRYTTVIARGAEFLAFRVHSNPTAAKGSFVGAPDAVKNAIAAAMDAPKVSESIREHAAVLEESLDGATARQIAAKRGWGDSKSAEQRAVRAQDRALAALSEAYKKAA